MTGHEYLGPLPGDDLPPVYALRLTHAASAPTLRGTQPDSDVPRHAACGFAYRATADMAAS